MNDAEIAKMMKKMPADMAEESAEFAVGNTAKTGNTVNSGRPSAPKKVRENFFMRPALSVAITAVLFVITAAVVMTFTLKNRNRSYIRQGGIATDADLTGVVTLPPATELPAGPSATPTAPDNDPKNAQILKYDIPLTGDYSYGLLKINDDSDLTEFLKKWSEYVKRECGEIPGFEAPAVLPTEEELEFRKKLKRTLLGTSAGAYWMDISSEEIKGIAQVMRCEYVSRADGDVPNFTADVLYADGEIKKVFMRDGLRTVRYIIPFDYKNNGQPGLLAVAGSGYYNGAGYALYLYDTDLKAVRVIYPSVLNEGLQVFTDKGDTIVINSIRGLGGKAVYDGNNLTIGGVSPAAFFTAAFGTGTDVPTADPTPTITPTADPTAAPATEYPTGSVAPTAEITTSAPTDTFPFDATPIPFDDPSNVEYLSRHMHLVTVAYMDGTGSYGGPELPKAYYMFNGTGMEYRDMSSPTMVVLQDTMRNMTASYKRGTLAALKAEKEITLLLSEDAELAGIDVWAVNDAENKDFIEFELIASALSEAEFKQFVSSGSMQFRPDLDTGDPLPCFALISAKKDCTYFEGTGESEYFINVSLVPFYTSETQNSGSVKLLRYNSSGDGVGVKEILPGELANSIIRMLKNAKSANRFFDKISDETVDENSGELPVYPGTMWIELGNDIYRVSPDMNVLCKVSGHLGDGTELVMPSLLPDALHKAWDYYPYDYYYHVYDYKSGIDYYDHVFEAESAIDVIRADISLKNENDPVDHAYLSLTSEIDQEVHFELECKRSEDVLASGESKTVFLEKGRTTDVRLNFEGWDDGPYYIYITFENVRIEFKFTP